MIKMLKYRLYPNTEKKLFWTLTRCRELYNAALQERRDAYNFHVRQHPNYYDESIGKIKTCTIKREVDQWYVTFACEVVQSEPLPMTDSKVGIDLGITHFVALSDGTFIESPRFFRKAQADLRRKQRHLSRCKRHSHRREKARKALAKAHRKIANQRRDFHHKHSTQLIKQHQVIVFEQLEPVTMSKRAKPKQDGKYLPNGASAKSGLNKSILDAGWGLFQQICIYKAANAGRTVMLVNPRYTSQICSQCGTVRKKDLSERWHLCDCGCSLDRDTNAAINILRLGSNQQSTMTVEISN